MTPSPRVRPDAFPTDAFATLVRHLPPYARLAWRLGRDPRLGRGRRAAIVAAAGYLVSPIDLVPGIIPVLGQLDDVLVAISAIRFALGGLPAAERERYLREAGLTERNVDEDRRTALATAAWIGRRGARLGLRVSAAAIRRLLEVLEHARPRRG